MDETGATFSRLQIELEVGEGPPGAGDRPQRRRGEQRPPEVGVDHDPAGVDHGTQRGFLHDRGAPLELGGQSGQPQRESGRVEGTRPELPAQVVQGLAQQVHPEAAADPRQKGLDGRITGQGVHLGQAPKHLLLRD